MVEIHLGTSVSGSGYFGIGEMKIIYRNSLSPVRTFQVPFILQDITCRCGKAGPAAFLHRFGGRVFDDGRRPDSSGVFPYQGSGLPAVFHLNGNGTVVKIGGDIRCNHIPVVGLDVDLNSIGLRLKNAAQRLPRGIKPARAGDGKAGSAGSCGNACRVDKSNGRCRDRRQNLLDHGICGRCRLREPHGKTEDQTKSKQKRQKPFDYNTHRLILSGNVGTYSGVIPSGTQYLVIFTL